MRMILTYLLKLLFEKRHKAGSLLRLSSVLRKRPDIHPKLQWLMTRISIAIVNLEASDRREHFTTDEYVIYSRGLRVASSFVCILVIHTSPDTGFGTTVDPDFLVEQGLKSGYAVRACIHITCKHCFWIAQSLLFLGHNLDDVIRSLCSFIVLVSPSPSVDGL